MPPRPSFLPIRGLCCRQIPTAPHRWSLYRVALSPCPHNYKTKRSALPVFTHSFHSSNRIGADVTNHYETLGLTPEANGADIKKQFYHLSKLHHPDHNPDDPNASMRFQSISNAYSVLGKPAKRQEYDRSLGIGTGNGSAGAPSGSHSSAQRASSPFGARPASGLNKRRGAFRGPPPSFYAAGGWGQHATKRRAAQHGGTSSSSSSTAGGMNGSTDGANPASGFAGGGTGGTYAGGGAPGSTGGMPGDEVRHFDRQRHFERQEEIDGRMAARRRAHREWEEREREAMQRDLGFKVILVTACIAGVWLVDVLIVSPWKGNRPFDIKNQR